jgi:hypothetical protein
MLSELKNFDARRMNLEELVTLATFGRALQAEFEALSVESPEWVGEQVKSIRKEIKSRNADSLAAKLRGAKAQLETLKTPGEKRRALETLIEKLEKQVKGA